MTATRIHGGEVDDLPAALPTRGVPRLLKDDKGRIVADGQKVFDAYTPVSLAQIGSDYLETRDRGRCGLCHRCK